MYSGLLFIRTHADPTPGPDPAADGSMGPDGSRRTAGSTHGSPDHPRPREFQFGKNSVSVDKISDAYLKNIEKKKKGSVFKKGSVSGVFE